VEIEDVPDEDTTNPFELSEWNGESTFWGDTEYFDDSEDNDVGPEYEQPVLKIPDPDGDNPEQDDTELENAAFDARQKRKFIFPPS